MSESIKINDIESQSLMKEFSGQIFKISLIESVFKSILAFLNAKNKKMSRFCCSKFSEAKFLDDDESLDDMIIADQRVLDENKVTFTDLAVAIDSIFAFWCKVPCFTKIGGYTHRFKDEKVIVSDRCHYRIKYDSHLGYQYCPFDQCCKEPAKYNGRNSGSRMINITKFIDGMQVENLLIGDLLCHLAQEHNFLEGKTCAFRIDPQKFIDFFGLTQEKDEMSGKINADWFAKKFESGAWQLSHTVDPKPEEIKMMDGIGGLKYSN